MIAKPSSLSPCAFACTVLLAAPALAHQGHDHAKNQPSATLPQVTVKAQQTPSAVEISADPRQPQLPASDAASVLKGIAGFATVRNGGSNSDIVLRGQFGSRLALLANGTQLLGACSSRMDSPSAYISPETFDTLTIVKGPQTVLWGPGTSAGVVRFDRERPDMSTPGVQFSASLLGASAGRNDQNVDLLAGNAKTYLRLTANHSHGQDYRDGSGQRVPSAWDKWNTDLALGLTPDANTLVELTAGAGDGHARYGARGMDGAQFRRDSWGLRLEKQQLTPWLTKLEAQLYRNQADHVMDNFSLRPFKPSGMMTQPMAVNVRRTTSGGRIAASVVPATDFTLQLGLDFSQGPHAIRKGMGAVAYTSLPWAQDARLQNQGLFAELAWQATADTRWVGGLRLDNAQAERYSAPNATDNLRRERALPSGFVRWEHQLAPGASVHAGLGHVERFPDYWELYSPSNSGAAKGNSFTWLRPEKTTQLDLGARWQGQGWQLWSAAYLGTVQDYIVFDYPSKAVRNVNARTAGLELGASRQLTPALSAQGTLAYAWGENTSDNRPLPQQPPLEARLGLDYAQGAWSAGALWRLVAAQHRHANGQGNVTGRDLGTSSGFGTLALHAGYRVNQQFKLSAGVDNLLDKTYSEHLNLAGNAGFGYPGSVRISEPGRTLWLRGDVKF